MRKNVINESEDSLKKAVLLLKNEKLVAVKTETVYGLACASSSSTAIKKVYNLKKRPLLNPLIIHVNSIDLAEKISVIDNDSRKIMEEFWPGPLTLILTRKKNNLVHELAVSRLETIAIRIPSSEFFLKLISKLKKPIAAPSANESGYISATDAAHVVDSFGEKVDLIIDSGRTEYGVESTILDMTTNPYEIKRLGVIDYKTIIQKLGKKVKNLNFKEKKLLRPNSPGQMLKHYAPKTPLRLNTDKPNLDDAFLDFGNKNTISHQPTLNLSKSSDLKEAAFNLFYFLRKLDKCSKKRIVVAPIPDKGIGKTINERLKRAAS